MWFISLAYFFHNNSLTMTESVDTNFPSGHFLQCRSSPVEDHNEGRLQPTRGFASMASATWRIRLLKLDLALVAKEKVVAHKSRPRRLRPRLTAEQLEDRTLPS